MSRTRLPVTVTLLAAVVAAGLAALAVAGRPAAGAGGLVVDGDWDTVEITPAARRAGLRFAPDVAPGDRSWILAAIAKARPDARRLIAEVDGLVTFETAGRREVMGLTRPGPDGFRVWVNVARLDGTRVVDRDTTVLHELGHVVDLALIPAGMFRTLDDGIPRGGPCERRRGVGFGGCAAPEERVADTFGKWALGGAVSALGAGYAIAAPASLEDWGRPLAALAGTLP